MRRVTFLHRSPGDPEGTFRAGDIFEVNDPPVYEIDAVTLKPKADLQCFRVGVNGVSITPISRRSWLT